MLLLAMLAAAAPFQFHVSVAEFPNAIYHLSCLSNRMPCSKLEIETFWHDDLRWADLDQQKLDAWNAALDAISKRQPQAAPSPFLPNSSGWYPNPAVTRRIVAAGLDSHPVAEFRKRAATLGSAGEISRLADVVEHFQKRLHPWWTSTGEPYAAARRHALQSVMRAPALAVMSERIAHFMESEFDNRNFHVDLVPRENPRTDSAVATVVGHHLLLEVVDQMKDPHEAVPIAMHELTHELYDLAPLRLHQKLMQEFAGAPEAESQALYAILNEGIANGIQRSLLKKEEADHETYRHPFIPRIGRAVSASVTQALEHGPTLFHGFVETYLRDAVAELEDEAGSPRFNMLSAMLMEFGKTDEAEKAYYADLAPISSAPPDGRERFPDANLVILITYDSLGVLAGNEDKIIPLSRQHRGFAFSSARGQKGRTWVLAGRNDQSVAEVVKRLAAIRTAVPQGLVLAVGE